MNAATTSRFHSDTSPASRQRSVSRRSMSSSSRSMRLGACAMSKRVGPPSDGHPRRAVQTGHCRPVNRQTGVRLVPETTLTPAVRYGRWMGAIRVGPARCPSRESPEAAVELLLERGYSACELDFERGFWMDYPWAERLAEVAREHDIALSVHAPLFAFPGHPDEKKGK